MSSEFPQDPGEEPTGRRTPGESRPLSTSGLNPQEFLTAGEATMERTPPATRRVGGGFIAFYALAYMGTWLALLSPLLVTLALRLTQLVGPDRAPGALGLVAGTGALLALFGNPFFGKMSDRTVSRFGMRRPWMIIGLLGGAAGLLVIALAPSLPLIVVGWCIAQLGFNALLAAQVAVIADQIPEEQRGTVSGILGICLPIALTVGSFVVQLVAPNTLAMFMFPVAIAAVFVLLFTFVLKDRRLDKADRPPWSMREFVSTFYVNPRQAPDFAWAWISRFLFVLGNAFLTTFLAFYLLHKLGSAQGDVARQIFLGTLAQSALVVVSSVIGGRISDKSGRRKIFVLVASVVFGSGLLVVALVNNFNPFLFGMALSGLGFGVYTAVDLALVTDVLPDPNNAAKDLGVFNIASAAPQSLAPAIAPAILAIGGGVNSGASYSVLYAVAAGCAVLSAIAILKVKGVR